MKPALDRLRPSRAFPPWWKSLLHIAAGMAVLTITFRLTNLDLAVQALFFRHGWFLDGNGLVQFLYRWGTLPGLLLGFGAAVTLAAGRSRPGAQHWRRAAMALLLTLFLGPGLMINGICKQYTGRPRPRETVAFGGTWPYRQVLDFGIPGRGHSFPAGHPSTGFLLFSLYFSFRRRNRRVAGAWLAAGGAYGGLMGVGRIVQGAHFLSDVVWSGGITLAAAVMANHLTGADALRTQAVPRRAPRARILSLVGGGGVMVALILAMLAATPHHLEKSFPLRVPPGDDLRLVLDLDVARVRVLTAAGPPVLRLTSRGFAPPSSRYDPVWVRHRDPGETAALLRLRRRGFFFEINADITIRLPEKLRGEVLIRCRRGDIRVDGGPRFSRVMLDTGEGVIDWRGKDVPRRMLVRNRAGDVRMGFDRLTGNLAVSAPRGEVTFPAAAAEWNWSRRHGPGKSVEWFNRESEGRAVRVAARSLRCGDRDQ